MNWIYPPDYCDGVAMNIEAIQRYKKSSDSNELESIYVKRLRKKQAPGFVEPDVDVWEGMVPHSRSFSTYKYRYLPTIKFYLFGSEVKWVFLTEDQRDMAFASVGEEIKKTNGKDRQ